MTGRRAGGGLTAGAARLQDKVVIVTGSTRGIGRATAEHLAASGAAVVVAGRNAAAGEEVAAAICADGGSARFLRIDLSVEADVEALVDEALAAYGRLDGLVNNATPSELVRGGADGPVLEISRDVWDGVLDVALVGAVRCCRHAIPAIADSGGGAVVNISSAASLGGIAGLDAYTAAKGAMNALTRSLAVEYGPFGVRVNSLALGFVVTTEDAERRLRDPEVGPALRALSVTRPGRPEDVAAAVAFLVSDEAEFLTGAVIPLDGGMTARSAFPPRPVPVPVRRPWAPV